MEIRTLLWRNIRWRYSNAFTIIITILQPLLWLLLYSMVASATMKDAGITNYTAFIMPGLFVLVSFGACSSSGIMNYLLKRDGSFYRILIAPVNRKSIVVAQMIEACICSIFEVIIMFIAGLFMGVRINCNIIGILLIVLLVIMAAFFMAGVTYSISLYLPNEVIFETVMNSIVLPLFFVSSALFPIDEITGVLRGVIYLNPFTHVINSIREIMNGYMNWSNIIFTFILFLVLGVISFSFAYYSLKKELR